APPGGRLPLGTPAISSDGRTLAYMVVDPGGVLRLYTRAIDGVETRALPGTEGAVHPFWSPRGDSLAFVAGFWLKQVHLADEYVRDLHITNIPWQGAWSQKDDILLSGGRGTGLIRISAHGGAPTPIPNSSGTGFPAFLSDGQRFLVRVSSSDNR